MQRFFSLCKRNSKIFALAIIFSFALLYVIKNPSFFQASVLNLGEIETIKKNQRDLAYKTTGNVLDIFIDDTLTTVSELTLSIAYDPAIQIQQTGWNSQGAYEVIGSGAGVLDIQLSQFTGIDPTQSILIIPFSGSTSHILVQEAYTVLSGTTHKDLAIGNLSEQVVHGK